MFNRLSGWLNSHTTEKVFCNRQTSKTIFELPASEQPLAMFGASESDVRLHDTDWVEYRRQGGKLVGPCCFVSVFCLCVCFCQIGRLVIYTKVD